MTPTLHVRDLAVPGFGPIPLETHLDPSRPAGWSAVPVRLPVRERSPGTPKERPRIAMIGSSPAMRRVLDEVTAAASFALHVLVTGATGTGKSQLARWLHEVGPRSAQPFVEVNCGAIPEPLVESELFGAVAGAHATAHRKVEGKVTAADGGTLLLDEIGELPLGAQAKLLQLLETKQYYPLGAARPLRADVRIVAATHQDLERLVERGRFRADLFYRLDVLRVQVPSLAERPEDIVPLAEHFVRTLAEEHGLDPIAFTPAALVALAAAPWPGNARQLRHLVERGVVRALQASAPVIDAAHLFPLEPVAPVAATAAELSDAALPKLESRERGSVESPFGSVGLEDMTFRGATRAFQRDLVHRALVDTGWNVSEAARRLELARPYLHRLLSEFGLTRCPP